MIFSANTISQVCQRIRTREVSATELVQNALASVRANESTRAFISLNPQALYEAEALDRLGPPENEAERPLHGIPISVKDIFDVAGLVTTCGSSFYASQQEIPPTDSAYIEAWRRTGAIIIGKTHLNEFAYGITGENQTYGPCLQPKEPSRLTGGSSSGAAASVQAGSSWIGLGTDTGGSIRVPSALCGLVGFRHSPLASMSQGMFPLAPSFDTCGWVQQHLSDLPPVYKALTGRQLTPLALNQTRIGFLDGDWLEPCENSIRDAFTQLDESFQAEGISVAWENALGFERAPEIFSALQAFEAAQIHRKFLASPEFHYDPAIRARLELGLALTEEELAQKRKEMGHHCATIHAMLERYDFLIAPACPYEKLLAHEDHKTKRRAILQLTTPFSLAGLPALTFPWGRSSTKYGWQILIGRNREDNLVRLAQGLSLVVQPGDCE